MAMTREEQLSKQRECQKRWVHENPEENARRYQAWRQTPRGWAKCVIKNMRSHAKMYGSAIPNFTPQDLIDLQSKWNGLCQSCQTKLTTPMDSLHQTGTSVHVDHCHRSGNLRGFLCKRCNWVVGVLEDSTTIGNCTKYLEGLT